MVFVSCLLLVKSLLKAQNSFLRIFSLLAGKIMADSSGRGSSDEAIENVGKEGRGMSMVRGKIR